MEFPLAVCSEIKLHYILHYVSESIENISYSFSSKLKTFSRVSLSKDRFLTHFLLLFCFKLSLCQREKKLLQQQQQQQREAEEQQHRLCFLWRLCAKLISILLLSDWDLNGVRSATLAAPHEINLQCEKTETKKGIKNTVKILWRVLPISHWHWHKLWLINFPTPPFSRTTTTTEKHLVPFTQIPYRNTNYRFLQWNVKVLEMEIPDTYSAGQCRPSLSIFFS